MQKEFHETRHDKSMTKNIKVKIKHRRQNKILFNLTLSH